MTVGELFKTELQSSHSRRFAQGMVKPPLVGILTTNPIFNIFSGYDRNCICKREKQIYADVLFIDTDTQSSRSMFPLSLDAFCSHLESRADLVREAMLEFWISDAAGLVGQHVAPLVTSASTEHTTVAR